MNLSQATTRTTPKQLYLYQPLALAALVVLSAALATSSFAQSSSRPSQGSSSSQGSTFKGRKAPSYRGSGSTQAFPGASSGSTSRSSQSGSSSKSPRQRSTGSLTRSGGQADNPYFKTVSRIEENESKINRLYSSIPIGFPGEQQKFFDQINAIKAENAKLKLHLEKAAIQSYQQDPIANAQFGHLLYKQMLQKIDPTGPLLRFDPKGALQVAAILIEGGRKNADSEHAIRLDLIAWQAFRASYAIQDFERAEIMLGLVAQQGTRIKSGIRKKYEQTRERWQQELKIRRLEGNTDDLPKVKFETTEGTFIVELFENHAPQTVANFIDLVEKKFYNDMPFFLVQPGDFSQTGCPNGDGTGDAGYKIPCECYREQIRYNFADTLNMVHEGLRDTGGSQFFISHQPNPKWDKRYTAFGRVKEGMDVVYRLRTVDKTAPDPTETEPSKIIKATVVWKRDHAYQPTRLKKAEVEDPTAYLDQLKENAENGNSLDGLSP